MYRRFGHVNFTSNPAVLSWNTMYTTQSSISIFGRPRMKGGIEYKIEDVVPGSWDVE
jgi:hypothetical protein